MTTVSAGNKITRLQADTSRLVSLQGELSKDVFVQAVKGRALKEPIELIMYGYLYNWFAVNRHVEESDDDYNIAPVGWRVPSDADWTALTDRIDTEHNVSPDDFGVGNHLKHCRQVSSPLGGEFDTSEHPRWDSHGTHYGRDTAGFSVVPAGTRLMPDGFLGLGEVVFFASSTEVQDAFNVLAITSDDVANIEVIPSVLKLGVSIRCCRNATVEEQALTDGTACDNAYDIDGNIYNTVKIGDLVWMRQNLATSRYRGGATIPRIEGNTAWANDTDGARCAYDNDDKWVFTDKEWI